MGEREGLRTLEGGEEEGAKGILDLDKETDIDEFIKGGVVTGPVREVKEILDRRGNVEEEDDDDDERAFELKEGEEVEVGRIIILGIV